MILSSGVISDSEVRAYVYRRTHVKVRNFAFARELDLKTTYEMLVNYVLDEDGHLRDDVRRDFLIKNQRAFGGRIL